MSLNSIKQLIFVMVKFGVLFEEHQNFALSSLPHIKIKILPYAPSLGFVCDLGVLTKCSGTLLNFCPCSTFHLYLLLPPLQPTFTRRTIGHCLGTFIALNVTLPPPF
jgi:hypothetical protein